MLLGVFEIVDFAEALQTLDDEFDGFDVDFEVGGGAEHAEFDLDVISTGHVIDTQINHDVQRVIGSGNEAIAFSEKRKGF